MRSGVLIRRPIKMHAVVKITCKDIKKNDMVVLMALSSVVLQWLQQILQPIDLDFVHRA